MKKQKAEESASCPEWDSSTPQSMGAISEPLRATERESDTNFDELDLFLSKKKKPRNKNRLVKFDSIQTTPSLTTADFCEVQCNLTTNEETDGLHTYSEVSDFFVEINSNLYEYSGRSRISPRRGRQLPRGAPTYDFAKFSQKLHEIERIWAPWRGRVPRTPLRSATGIE